MARRYRDLVDETEATLRAALMREESRGTFYRTDFPETDESWEANIACRLVDGAMQMEKVDIVR